MFESLRTGLLDAAGGMHIGSLFGLDDRDESPAEQFASWLPYSAYIGDEAIFVNRDSLGFMLEIMPQSGADERMVEVLISLYATCPKGAGIQFHLFASPHVRNLLRRYANLRTEDEDQTEKARHWGRPARNDNLFRRLARQRVAHLLHGAQKSMTAGFHYTVRDFRLMMSVALPGAASDLNRRDELIALREAMATTLRAASLPNRTCDAADLINWCSLFTNPDRISRTAPPVCTTTTAARSATRSSISTRSRMPMPTGCACGRKAIPVR